MKRPETNRTVLTLGEFCVRVSTRKSHHLDDVQRKGLTGRKQDITLLLLLLLSRVSHIRLSNPMDCSLPGSSVRGIFQARVLEWGAIAFSDKVL